MSVAAFLSSAGSSRSSCMSWCARQEVKCHFEVCGVNFHFDGLDVVGVDWFTTAFCHACIHCSVRDVNVHVRRPGAVMLSWCWHDVVKPRCTNLHSATTKHRCQINWIMHMYVHYQVWWTSIQEVSKRIHGQNNCLRTRTRTSSITQLFVQAVKWPCITWVSRECKLWACRPSWPIRQTDAARATPVVYGIQVGWE